MLEVNKPRSKRKCFRLGKVVVDFMAMAAYPAPPSCPMYTSLQKYGATLQVLRPQHH